MSNSNTILVRGGFLKAKKCDKSAAENTKSVVKVRPKMQRVRPKMQKSVVNVRPFKMANFK